MALPQDNQIRRSVAGAPLLPRPRIENRTRDLACRIPDESDPRMIAASINVKFIVGRSGQRYGLTLLEIENWPSAYGLDHEFSGVDLNLQGDGWVVNDRAGHHDINRMVRSRSQNFQSYLTSRLDCRFLFWAQSGHRATRRKCPLVTHSGHRRRPANLKRCDAGFALSEVGGTEA